MKIRTLFGYLLGAMASADATGQTFEELIAASHEYLQTQQERLKADFALASHERWDIDQEKGELVFSNSGIPTVVARFQFVGSYSKTSGSWLWSWANSSVLPSLSTQMEEVRAFGERGGFEKLTVRKWDATEEDGWDMAAITNYVLKGKGVYRPPFEQGVAFLVITEIRRVSQ